MIREKVGAAWGWILAALLVFVVKAVPKPHAKEKMHWTEVELILRKKFPHCDIKTWDLDYKVPTKDDMMAWMRKYWLPILKIMTYRKDESDCDDYARAFWGVLSIYGMGGRPIGYLIVDTPQDGHAVAVFLDVDKTIWVIEPQQKNLSEAFFAFPDEWEAKEIRM